MAVHLKKRACEEFSHVIQGDNVPLKRLRLTRKKQHASERDPPLKLRDDQSRDEKLKELIQFSKVLPLPSDEARQCVTQLFGLFAKEKDSSVRTKIAWLIGNLSLTVKFNFTTTLKDIVGFIKKEKSNQVITQLWSTLLDGAKSVQLPSGLHEDIVKLAYNGLRSMSHLVRSKCLLAVGSLGKIKSESEPSQTSKRTTLQAVVGNFFSDPEPRVRCSALQAMILLHERRHKLEFQVYSQACAALLDDYESVRVVALKLVWISSNVYPENRVRIAGSDEKIRLVDDAFVKICDMVNDSSYKVRAAAAGLLGSMRLVGNSFLFQTLDKKLMSDLKKKKSLNEKAKEGYVGEFSSGAKWADDAPKDVDTESEQLMSGGACGAFVHGLEDEMLEVRMAAVDSLTELACHRSASNFPQAALDFLVDCLNDEIEAVRLNAVHSLHKIMQDVCLLEDQLDNVLAGMDDFSVDIREGLHLLLSNCSLTSKYCLNITIMRLLKNLNKYPQDKLSVWKAYQCIGKHHGQLVYLLVPHLLSCHPYFDMPEPNMDDPGYIGVLILVFNAARDCPKMMQMFPEHVIRHYQYLRDSIPELVPQGLKLMTFANGADTCLRSPPRGPSQSDDQGEFLERTLQRVKNLKRHDLNTQKRLLTCTINDLKHIARVMPKLSSTAASSAKLLQAQLLLSDILDTRSWSGSAIASTQLLETLRPAAKRIETLTFELEHLYLGLSTGEVTLLRQMRLKAHALEFLIDMQRTQGHKSQSKHASEQRCSAFLKAIADARDYLEAHSQEPDSFSKTLFNEVLKLEPTKHSLVMKLLQPLLLHYSVSNVTFSNTVREAKISIHSPVSKTDSSISISAGLTAALDIDATASNVDDPIRNVKIEVLYPDSTSDVVSLQPRDVKKFTSTEHRITAKVIVGHQQWTDACLIKLRFVKVFDKISPHDGQPTTDVLPLSDTVELLLHPKPVLRA